MIIEISHFFTILATGLFLLSGIFAVSIKNTEYVSNLISRTYSHAFLFLLISFGLYVWLAATDNFSVLYIASHSNSDLPTFYKISSIWSAHEGSMFLWIVFLALWGYLFNFNITQTNPIKSLSIGILSLIIVGFLLFLLLTSNPFQTILPIPPSNGADINPVLQDPALVIPPPTLYLGYVGFGIPFACALAFLIKGNTEIGWELMVQKWSVVAWIFLTIGITLGRWWAYYELGWGGYWFWDPVENVALMPWLAATAFIHSLSVSIKSKRLRVWTLLLSILVFSLSLFGAFIVRSGIIDSVHSFANDPERGLYLLGFISVIIITSLVLFVIRFSKIQSITRVKRFSKESFISINNIFFGVLVFSVMLGVIYPLIYEYLFNQKISVGAPFYTAIFSPIVLIACIFLIFSIDSKWSREFKLNLMNSEAIEIVNYYFNSDKYNDINLDFINNYNSPSFLISLVDFLEANDFSIKECTIEDLLAYIIKNKLYTSDEFIKEYLNLFIELFFYKNINNSKNISFKIKKYFYLKLSFVKKYNLDFESFFLEFNDKLLSE